MQKILKCCSLRCIFLKLQGVGVPPPSSRSAPVLTNKGCVFKVKGYSENLLLYLTFLFVDACKIDKQNL